VLGAAAAALPGVRRALFGEAPTPVLDGAVLAGAVLAGAVLAEAVAEQSEGGPVVADGALDDDAARLSCPLRPFVAG
jgi:hypothetical protein